MSLASPGAFLTGANDRCQSTSTTIARSATGNRSKMNRSNLIALGWAGSTRLPVCGSTYGIANSVKQQVWALDKDQPVSQVDSMENMLSEWIAPARFTMTILLAFGALALILAAVGLYSVLAYAVTLRTREIGVRVALGAEPRRVASMILREGVGLTIIGVAIGLAGSFALTRYMQSLMFGISALDATTFLLVSGILAAIAIMASDLPARRASLINPLEALRAE